MNITIRCSELDQFKYYRQSDDMSVEDLVSRLRGETPPSDAMLSGTAWHKVLEDPESEISTIEKDGFEFIVDADAQIHLPQMREIRGNVTMDIEGYRVTLTGQVDGLSGLTVYDHKLTGRPDPTRYAESLQWRSYLYIFGADRFVYYLFGAKRDGKKVTIYNVQEVTFYRYPSMRADIEKAVRDFVAFVIGYLPERIV